MKLRWSSCRPCLLREVVLLSIRGHVDRNRAKQQERGDGWEHHQQTPAWIDRSGGAKFIPMGYG